MSASRDEIELVVAKALKELLQKAKLKPSMEQMLDIVKAVTDVVEKNNLNIKNVDFKEKLRPTLTAAIGLRTDPNFDHQAGLDLTNPMDKLKLSLTPILLANNVKRADFLARDLLFQKLENKIENNPELKSKAIMELKKTDPSPLPPDLTRLSNERLLGLTAYAMSDGAPIVNDAFDIRDQALENNPVTRTLMDVYGESEEQNNKASVESPVDTPEEVRKFKTPFDSLHKGPQPPGHEGG